MEPLTGIRVVDLTKSLAGPYCTMMLGDLGAEVIKVEQPGTGDETRGWGPPFVKNTTDSAYFFAVNRNKKSITLNLKTEKGKEILWGLIKRADVLVESYRVGALDRLGFGYKYVCEINPKLIYCSITGYGTTGPYASRGGYDVIVQGMGGIMSITGPIDGEPYRVGVPIVDVTTGMFALHTILAALFARVHTNKGQKVEVSLFESQVAWLSNVAGNYLVSKELPKRLGNAHPNIAPYEPYKASDKYFIIAVGNEKLWKTFCNIINCPELIEDERFKTNALRVKNRNELNNLLSTIFIKKSAKEWTDLFIENSIPAGPINNLEEVFSDPQIIDRQMVVEIDHPLAGKVPLVNSPLKFSDTPISIRLHPPSLGEHNIDVLNNILNYSLDEIEKLKSENII